MTQKKDNTPDLPGPIAIYDELLKARESGLLKLPMEDKLTVGQLIRGDGGFERGEAMVSVESELISLMAMGKIHGMDTQGYFPEFWGVADDATARKQIEITREKDFGADHQYFGLIKGSQSEKAYLAELNKVAQQFVEQVYPELVKRQKGGK